MAYYLAVDIGASSGRHILGEIREGKLHLEEVYRFENGIDNNGECLTWDIDRLFNEVVNGLKKCAELGKYPKTMAIDTWGVDYVLLDKDDQPILPVVAYRDSRTHEILPEVDAIISRDDLYRRTGIQRQYFNTIFQLYCDKKSGKLDNAERMLMIPEYLVYRLTGKAENEYTNASTTSLLNAETRDWDWEVLDKLGIKKEIFGKLNMPATLVGSLKDEIKEKVGFDLEVIFAPSHDTASAVAACPVGENGMYISSGTWSLAGVENTQPITQVEASNKGFTNEGGVNNTYRFLKNIMGMWLFQNIRRNTNKQYSYNQMMAMAEASTFTQTVDVNAAEFVAPENMIDAIRGKLGMPELPFGDVLSCVYHSLAELYRDTANEIEELTGKKIEEIHIVGGGGADTYLNRLTARKSGRPVFTGLKEATAVGNMISQIMYDDKDMTLEKCRELVKASFAVTKTV